MSYSLCLFRSQVAKNPVFLLAGALLFDEKITKVALYFGLDCGMMDASRNPKNNWCLSRIYGVQFGEKDRGLSTYKPWSEQAGGLDSILHEAAQDFEAF